MDSAGHKSVTGNVIHATLSCASSHLKGQWYWDMVLSTFLY